MKGNWSCITPYTICTSAALYVASKDCCLILCGGDRNCTYFVFITPSVWHSFQAYLKKKCKTQVFELGHDGDPQVYTGMYWLALS